MKLEDAFSTLKIEPEVEAQSADTPYYPFPRFPTEIRLRIWRLAIEAIPGRIIPITEVLTFTNKPGKERRHTYTCTRPHPTISTVSREARAAVFLYLKPLFRPGMNYPLITVCLEKDTLLWDAIHSSSSGTLHSGEYKRFAEAIGSERCREMKVLAVEDTVDYDKWSCRYNNLLTVLAWGGNAKRILEIFPNIETMGCVIIKKFKRHGNESAKFHIGDLELVPTENILYRRLSNYAQNELLESRLNIKYFELGLAGGEKRPKWDPVKRRHFWRLMTEEEKEREKVKVLLRDRRVEAAKERERMMRVVGTLEEGEHRVWRGEIRL